MTKSRAGRGSSGKAMVFLMALFTVSVAAAGGFGYFYYKNGRFPTLADLQGGGRAVVDKTESAAGGAKQAGKPVGCPVELDTTSTDERSTTVIVSVKKEFVADLRDKYAKIRVVIPELDVDAEAWQTSWPLVIRKVIPGNRTTRLENCSCTVYGIGMGGLRVEIWKR